MAAGDRVDRETVGVHRVAHLAGCGGLGGRPGLNRSLTNSTRWFGVYATTKSAAWVEAMAITRTRGELRLGELEARLATLWDERG